MNTKRVNPHPGSSPESSRRYVAILSQDHLLGDDSDPTPLAIPTPPNWERIALTGLAVALSLVGLTITWATLSGSYVQTALFTTLVVGVSVTGAVSLQERTQSKRLQQWRPFLGERSRNERESFVSTIVTLANALEARDTTTRNHSSKVANLSVRVGRHMGLSHEQLYEIHLGGLLHDIGKIGIRDEILMKPTGLTRSEYEIMKRHPQVGYEILSGVPGMTDVAEIVRHHHEMWNGDGYPSGLAGEEIPLGARLVAVADTYMALTENRPYRDGRTVEKTFKELRRVAGRQLDPLVIDHLEQMIQEDRIMVERRRTKRAA